MTPQMQAAQDFAHWRCAGCKDLFIDRDENPRLNSVPKLVAAIFRGIEAQIYWLGLDTVFCAFCAQLRGIPPTLE